MRPAAEASGLGALRRELGTLESYAALLGILIGAGIFKVTSDSWALTGPSVILAHAVLVVPVLATSVAYSVFLSTPLGTEPGGEYTHLARTFGGLALPFVGAWLKIISYVGALAYLALAFADYVLELFAGAKADANRISLALGSLAFFLIVHALGVRWFGRLQVAMLALLGVSIAVLVLPGLLAIEPSNYRPFFTHGPGGFAAALPPLFFAYAGFESLAQTAGEVRDSRRRLPRVFLGGILGTAVVFLLMSVVAFGVLPGERLQGSPAPMAEVGAQYLHAAAAWFVTLGAVLAITTSINATMLVPSRLALVLVRDGLAPAWIGSVSTRTGTPVRGLALTFLAAVALLLSGQVSLALNIAVFALVGLYLLHSLALLLLPRLNPELFRSALAPIPLWLQRVAAATSIASMSGLILLQLSADTATLRRTTLVERLETGALTTIELILAWGAVGGVLYAFARATTRRRSRSAPNARPDVLAQPDE